ncbi:XRE family transcriptional regulator [Floricoccus tropicus]|uniref:XRE family transcriptional regulator n=1 Tax=Floricoccus tropicus TaxID=1859473 RepID=A0A1E8GLK2_9LACT|nr:helix-turn-helix domain-containing protein [Floricoccus tropicus]OFI48513.1 XRE family transcriptional regulator [Floricoccus tropicus]
MALGESLSKARKDKNLTQDMVAEQLYVTRQTVSRWEQNKTMPNIYVLKELSSLYDLSLEQLVSEKTDSSDEADSIDSGGKKMTRTKINWFALIGVLIFNVLLALTVFTVVGAVLFSIWLLDIVFIASPLILLIANVSGVQAYANDQTVYAIIFFVIGIVAFPIIMRITKLLVNFFVKYVKYNVKAIYN